MASCKRLYYQNRRQVIRILLFLLFIWVIWIIYSDTSRHRSDKISVVVVEEHHEERDRALWEALPYWIHAANTGQMPKSGNTLIHIDGHSDSASLEVVDHFPLFRWPENQSEIFSLLQSNDEFVIAAVVIGLIDRFIWVVPGWSKDSIEIKHKVSSTDIGWAKVTNSTGQTITVLCFCEEAPDESSPKGCYYEDIDEPEDSAEVKLGMDDCHIMRTYTEEILHINQAKALVASRTGNSSLDWLKPSESIILDIDEDYFGCELPGQLLYDAGMMWKEVEKLDDKFYNLFCLQTTQDEHNARIVMANAMETLVKLCAYSETSYCTASFEDVLDEMFDLFSQSWETNGEIYCSGTKRIMKSGLKTLIRSYHSLSKEKVLAIQKVGFCLETTPNSTFFYSVGNFQICHGANDPKDPMVQVSVPDSEELASSMEKLEDFLDILPLPSIVTICRSIRDGYTPRSIFQTVENNLLRFVLKKSRLAHMNNKHLDKNMFHIQYDPNLLNGIDGLGR